MPAGRPRVVHIYQQFHPERGGIQDFLFDLTRYQSESGALEPVVLTAGATGRTSIEHLGGVKVIRAATFGRYFTPFCPTWPSWLQRLQPAIVHVHVPCPMAEATALLVRPKCLVVSLHNDYVRPAALVRTWWPMHRATLARAARVVVGTHAYAATSAALKPVDERLAVIPYGVRPDLDEGLEAATNVVRERYGGPLIVFLGRLCYYKGLSVLLDAARAIRATFLLIGDGPFRHRVEQQAAKLSNVRVLGALPERDTLAHLRAASVFVFPSTHRSEAYGLAQLKAMAVGVPVVSSDLPGVAWVNQHGETGLCVPTSDADALASALRRLLGDPALHARLSSGARRRARELTLDRMGSTYSRLYESCLSSQGACA